MEKKPDIEISALVDGECSSDDESRLLELMCEDERLAREWGRLHHLKSLLKNEHSQIQCNDSLAARVLAEIEQIELQHGSQEYSGKRTVEAQLNRRRPRFQWRPLWLGGALATVACGIAVFSAVTTIFETTAPTGEPALMMTQLSGQENSNLRFSINDLTRSDMDTLNKALKNHYKFSSAGAFNNVSHLVRVVSINSESQK